MHTASIIFSRSPATLRTLLSILVFWVAAVPATWAGAPSILTVSEQNISANQTSTLIGFTVDDAETAAGDLVVTASSSDQSLVPDGGLVVGGSGGARTLTVTPAPGRTGVATVTLTVTDGDAESVPTSFLLAVGVPVSGLRREIYRGLNGWMLSELLNSPKYPDSPDLIAFSPSFETPSEDGDLYGQRLTAYLRPPVSGNYVFYVASDDGSELYLSPNENPGNKVLIASEPAWSGWRAWVDAGSQQVYRGDPPANISSPIPLEAGKIYYMEMVHVEGWGGDKAAVTWQLPGAPPPLNGAPPIPGRYLVSFVAEAPEAVTMADPNLEAAVREAIDKPSGPIYRMEMEGMLNLTASKRGISNLSGLEVAVNLRRLSVDQNQITDLTPLAGLTQLQDLNVENNRITSVAPVAKLTLLNLLFAGENQIADISPLRGLVQLRYLGLSSNSLESITDLQNLSELTYLNIQWTGIADISVLAGLTKLTWLSLGANPVTDGQPLANLSNLGELHLWQTSLQGLQFLQGLTNLRVLTLANGGNMNIPAGDWTVISNLQHLVSLNIERHGLSSLEFLRGNTNLEFINCWYNRISDLSVLITFPRLSTLLAGWNWISQIPPALGASSPTPGTIDLSYNILDPTPGSLDMTEIERLQGLGFTVSYAPLVTPPSLTSIAPQSRFAGAQISLPFMAGDPARSADITSVTVASSDQRIAMDAGLMAEGDGSVRTLEINTLASGAGTTTITITVHHATGSPEVGSFPLTTYPGDPLTRFIEAEDFDFDAGEHVAAADELGYASGGYEGRVGVHGVDYFLNSTTSSGQPSYRSPTSPIVPLGLIGETGWHISTYQHKWSIPWNNPGNWFNYTRHFPAGWYRAYAVFSGSTHTRIGLSEVTHGQGTSVQLLHPLGTFHGVSDSGWDMQHWVPLLQDDGAPADIYLSGERTLRWTINDGWAHVDYLALVPMPLPDPGITAQPPDQLVNIGDSATFGVTPAGTGPFSFQWRKNGVNMQGQTGASLTLNNVQLADAADYSVVVSNMLGTYTSAAIHLRFTGNTVVVIADANLEAAVREALIMPSGLLTVADMANLNDLSASHRGIASLSGLEAAVNLQRLWVNENQIADLTPLAGLANLKELNVENNRIMSTAPLTGITGLNVLYLNGNQITDITPLQGMVQLRVLGLGGNPLGQASVVSHFKELSYLNLQFTGVRDLSPLDGMTGLRNLFVDGNPFLRLDTLPALPELTELSVNFTGITDYSALTPQRVPKLNRLIAEANGIRSLAFLEHMPALRDLAVSWNQIADIRPVLTQPGLRLFNFGGNWVSDVSALASLPHLTSCFCPNNFLDLTPGLAARLILDQLSSRPGASIYFSPQNPLPGGLDSLRSPSVLAGQSVPGFPFTAGDPARAGDLVSITATSSDQSVVADSGLSMGGDGLVRTLDIATIPGHSGTATITVTANYNSGAPVTSTFTVTTVDVSPGSLFIEAEDFDYGHGQFVRDVEIGMGGAYAGGSFEGLGDETDAGIDWGTTGGNAGQSYRLRTGVAAGKRNEIPDGFYRGTFDLEVNHVVGWNDAGDWMNYTREFPRGIYEIYGRFSSGGLEERAQLDLVTAGAGTPDQSLTPLGTFSAPATGGWDVFHLVPLRSESGEPSRLVLSGEQTLRFTVLPGNMDFDYLVFVPRDEAPDPEEATLQPVRGECPFTLTARPTATDDLDGVVTGTTEDAVTFQSPGTYSVRWTFTDTAGLTASAVQSVTVSDQSAPAIACPADIHIGCSVDPLVPVTFSVTASDACDPAPVIVSSPPSGAGFLIGTTVVQCMARDASGNETQCSFSVTREALGFSGFRNPIGGADATGGSFASPVRVLRAGANVAVRFEATCNGSAVKTGTHRLAVRKWTSATSSIPVNVTGFDEFRLVGGDWVLSVETKGSDFGPGIYELIATLSDGSRHTAWIRLR